LDVPRYPEREGGQTRTALQEWERNVATLDTAILSLIGEADVPSDGIEAALDAILQSSLWHRGLLRISDGSRNACRTTLLTRSRFIWARLTPAARRGYFLAGLGLEAGHALDAIAPEASDLLVRANAALLESNAEAAIDAITALAKRIFGFYPFTPDPFPDNWRAILRIWLLGQPLAQTIAGQEGDALQFIEGGLVYRLPWAMEALKVLATSNGDIVGEFGLALDDYELGLAVPAVETGTMSRSASILIQAGFISRPRAARRLRQDSSLRPARQPQPQPCPRPLQDPSPRHHPGQQRTADRTAEVRTQPILSPVQVRHPARGHATTVGWASQLPRTTCSRAL
jgi:hypothetical protein